MSEVFELPGEADTLAFGSQLAQRLSGGGMVYLQGDLGLGKTTLVRGLLRAMGFSGRVKSPSYGLIESYEVAGLAVHHLDLYRLSDGEELLYLGLEDLFEGSTLMLVEWPEKGRGYLPEPDWRIRLEETADGGRRLYLDPKPA